jgi:hypothetical protein
MNAARYDWPLSDASRGYRLASDDLEIDESERVSFRQELLSALAVAALALAAIALLLL